MHRTHRPPPARGPAVALPGIAAALLLSLTACAAPGVRYFTPPPAGYEGIGTAADTVLIRGVGDIDTVSADGVRWAAHLHRAARRAGAADVAPVLESLLASVPGASDLGLPTDDEADRDLVIRLSGQGPARMMELTRADALVVTAVRIDTVTIVSQDSLAAEGTTAARWLALLSSAALYIDPALGIRADVR